MNKQSSYSSTHILVKKSTAYIYLSIVLSIWGLHVATLSSINTRSHKKSNSANTSAVINQDKSYVHTTVTDIMLGNDAKSTSDYCASAQKTLQPIESKVQQVYFPQCVTIQQGDTLSSILKRFNLQNANDIVKHATGYTLNIGQTIYIHPDNVVLVCKDDLVVINKSGSKRKEIPIIYTYHKLLVNKNILNTLKQLGVNINNININAQVHDKQKINILTKRRTYMDRVISNQVIYISTDNKNKYYSSDGITFINSSDVQYKWPANKRQVNCKYGHRKDPISGLPNFHHGIDIDGRHGDHVLSTADGKIIFAGWKNGYGNVIYIKHANGVESRYGHLSKIHVKVGQSIKQGAHIGNIGATGHATGPHIHFEIRKNGKSYNPLLGYLDTKVVIQNGLLTECAKHIS